MRFMLGPEWLGWSRSSVIILCLILGLPAAACALNPDRTLDQYTRQLWSLDNGLPQASVTAMVQGRDDYLYIATFGGLLRFDGIRFEAIEDGGCGNRFSSLAEDEQGVLWAGISRGGLCRVERRQGRQLLVPVHADDGQEAISGISSLYPRSGGGVWVGTINGLYEVSAEGTRFFDLDAGLTDIHVTRVVGSSDGAIWVLTDSGICRFAEGRCVMPDWSLPFSDNRLEALLETRDGSIWVSRLDQLFQVHDQTLEQIELPDDIGVIADLLEDSRGNLWMASARAGLTRVRPRIERGTPTGESVMNARTLFQDRETNLWVGYSGDGLERLSNGRAYAQHVPDRERSLDVVSIEETPDGNLWVAVPCTGLARIDSTGIQLIDTRSELGTGCAWSLLAEDDGQLWVGTYGGGLGLRTASGELISMNGPPSHEGLVRAIVPDRATGELLIGTDEGVYRFGRQAGDFRLIEGTKPLDVHFLTTDAQGAIWIGSRSGATRIGKNDRQHFGREQGLADDYVRAIKIDPNGVVWLGTYGGGLHRLVDDKLTRIGMDSGLPDDIVSRIVEDQDSRFWMTGNRGVVRVERAQLEAYARGELERIDARLFNTRDGMPISETNGVGQPAGLLRDNGDFWVPTVDGLAVFDTRTPDRMPEPPPIIIERVLLDGRSLDLDQPIELSTTARNLEIHYTAPAFRAPERVRFRYRLDGYDNSWTEAGDRRVAYFPIIPPGELTFRVTAARGSGTWNSEVAALPIRMERRFDQTPWFLPTLLLTVAGLVALLFWVRNRDLRLRKNELQIEVDKRTAELAELATLDGLTGVANRRAFDQRLKSEWSRLRRNANPLTVLMIDVDHFKTYNDHYGHWAGDECLKAIAATLSDCLRREIELLARIGGEEFGVILPECDAEEARRCAERLRTTIEALGLPHHGVSEESIVTVSIGLATRVPTRDVLRSTLVRDADDALYRAKRGGRNRVES